MAKLNSAPSLQSGQSGQAVLEYVLLLVIVASAFIFVSAALGKLNVASLVMKPLTGDFAHAYRYGHPKALGFDDGGPKQHPRINVSSGDNFRIFYVRAK
jgi:hypothetical protein